MRIGFLVRTGAIVLVGLGSIGALVAAWYLQPDVIPSWQSAALEAASDGDCSRVENILQEVSAAGAAGTADIAQEVEENGQCPAVKPIFLAETNNESKPTWLSFGGSLFDPYLQDSKRLYHLAQYSWPAQRTYVACWRRFNPDTSVDIERIARAVSTTDEPGPVSSWGKRRAVCAERQYQEGFEFLHSDDFNYEKGEIGHQMLLRAEKMGHAMATFVRGKMLLKDDWRFHHIDDKMTKGYDAVHRAALANYPPAERYFALEAAERKEIKLPDEETYFWLLRAQRNWTAHDGTLERRLRDYANKLGRSIPESDLDTNELQTKTENTKYERL